VLWPVRPAGLRVLKSGADRGRVASKGEVAESERNA
jgi:hypothetical protein